MNVRYWLEPRLENHPYKQQLIRLADLIDDAMRAINPSDEALQNPDVIRGLSDSLGVLFNTVFGQLNTETEDFEDFVECFKQYDDQIPRSMPPLSSNPNENYQIGKNLVSEITAILIYTQETELKLVAYDFQQRRRLLMN